MAGIDKTYLRNYGEYLEIKNYLTPELIEQCLIDTKGYGISIPEYEESDFNDDIELVLWNTSSLQDLWIAKNIKIDFIQERLKAQYSDDWIGWLDEIDFNSMGNIHYIEDTSDGSSIVLYESIEGDDDHVNLFEELIFYGTTNFLRLFHDAIEVCRGVTFHENGDNLYIDFTLFGLAITYEDKEMYYKGKEVSLGYYPKYVQLGEDGLEDKDTLRDYMNIPTIKHSYDINDSNTYNDGQIIISTKNESFNVTLINEFDRKYLVRYFHIFLDDYMKDNINQKLIKNEK